MSNMIRNARFNCENLFILLFTAPDFRILSKIIGSAFVVDVGNSRARSLGKKLAKSTEL